MLSKINPSVAVAQCWYLRRHVPGGRRRREEDGAVHCTCRYCRRPIRSRDGGKWDLAEAFDLDALAEAGRTSHFAVVDVLDGMVIARYPFSGDLAAEVIAARLAEIREMHRVEGAGGALEVRFVQSRAGSLRVH
ncbi:MAG TPA: hypothetical protein VJQ77_02005 [Novosphingobium sp.]|nr:hypothetical protein [Novosphingobium sp.]